MTITTPTLKPLPLADTNPLPLEDGVPPPHLAEPIVVKAQRLVSLDVFRGITIAAMIMVNNMADPKYTPLEHAEWHGWTLTDLIFPFFLFIVGVAIPFSFARRSTTTQPTRGQMLARVWLRAISLFMLGQLMFAWPMPMTKAMPDGFMGYKALRIACFVFIYGSLIALLVPWKWKRVQYILPPLVAVVFYALLVVVHYTQKHATEAGWDAGFGVGGIFNPTNLRIPGVLQRIGIVYGFAGTIALFLGWRTIIAAIVVLCGVYAAVMLKVPYGPEHKAGSLTFEDNLARHVDETVFDRYTIGADGKRVYTQRHTYNHYPDNEGLLSTIPAIATSLLGILVGLWLRTSRSPVERAAGLLAMGMPVLILGCLLNWWLMPINKILWTPSYVFYTGGLAMLCLGFLFWLVDVLGWRRWALPFVIFGMNAIAAYVASSVVPKMLNLIQVRGWEEGKKVGAYAWLKHYYTFGIQQASDWVANLNPHMPVIATPMNMTLANSLCLVFVLWILMALLYVCRVFVKV